jgi:hypothetical protein
LTLDSWLLEAATPRRRITIFELSTAFTNELENLDNSERRHSSMRNLTGNEFENPH